MQSLTDKIVLFLASLEDRPFLAMVLLLGGSIVIKALLIFQVDIINTDGIRYINSAHELFQGNIAAAFAHEKMLGFTFLLGLVQLLVPDWFLAGKILSLIALVLTTIPLYLIAQELFGRRAAFCTAVVFTVVPSISGKCASVIKDPSFLFLIVLSLWFVLSAIKTSRWGFALTAGLLCCLSVLIRPEGGVFFLVITLFLTVSLTLLAESRRLILKSLLAFCALPFGALLLAAILSAAGVIPSETLSKIYARFSYYFQSDPMQVYGSIYQHLKDVEENFPGGQWTNDFFEYARYNIYLVYLIGMLQTFGKSLFPVFVIPLIYGLNLRNHWNRSVALLLTVLGCFFLMDYLYLISHNFLSVRYLLVPLVLSSVLVGHGMDRLITSISTFRYRRIAFSVVIVFCLLMPLGKMLTKGVNEKIELKEAGNWLLENRELTRDRIIVNDERIAYYAGLLRGDYDTFRDERAKGLEEKALRKDAGILVIYKDSGNVEKTPVFEEFTLVETFPGHNKVAMIYERKTI